jgi:hypothetical protein
MENIRWFINFMVSFFFLWGKIHDKTPQNASKKEINKKKKKKWGPT